MTNTFLLSEAAQAADNTSLATIRSWVQRGHLTFDGEDRPAGSNGLPHHVSEASALRLAITVRLVNGRALTPAVAWRAAGKFSHSGRGPVPDKSRAPRDPGNLFAEGQTFLIIDTKTERAAVENLDSETSLFGVLRFVGGNGPHVFLGLDEIVLDAKIKLERISAGRSFARARSLGMLVEV